MRPQVTLDVGLSFPPTHSSPAWAGIFWKHLPWKYGDPFAKLISTGTSTNSQMTAAKACPGPMPNTAAATAMVGSKLSLAVVQALVRACLWRG